MRVGGDCGPDSLRSLGFPCGFLGSPFSGLERRCERGRHFRRRVLAPQDFEHDDSAGRAFAFDRLTPVLHQLFHRVCDFLLGLAFYAITLWHNPTFAYLCVWQRDWRQPSTHMVTLKVWHRTVNWDLDWGWVGANEALR